MAQPGFQNITVQTLVNGIFEREYFLPSIQREFVWGTDRISKLFDSLMRGYPIGSFLFWEVPKDGAEKYQFYEFIRNYHERDRKHNEAANLTGFTKKFFAILDGQQRMNSLYIGLKGSYSERLRYKKKNKAESYPEKKLYLNLLETLDDLDKDLKYNFQFLTKEEAAITDDKHFWFEVGEILAPNFDKLSGVSKYVKEKISNSNEIAVDILETLYEQIRKEGVINYYLETADDLDKVTNIFIRVNSGGLVLNPSDLLLSFATANLHGVRDVRGDIYKFVDLLNDIGNKDDFKFDKDFVLKAMLVLTPKITSIKFKVSNFDKNYMTDINENWDKITRALELAVILINEHGFTRKDFKSNNSIIPLAHYIFNKGNDTQNYAKDKTAMIHWFIAATITGMFGSSTDGILTTLRNILQKKPENFPLEEMLDKDFKKNILVDTILDLEYKDAPILMALHILYPNVDLKNKHIDHIFPQAKFNDKIFKRNNLSKDEEKFYNENCNFILNLQLLEGPKNQSKRDEFFDVWLKKEFAGKPEELQHYKKENCIPDVDLSFGNFKEFLAEREKLMRQKLEENLKAWKIF